MDWPSLTPNSPVNDKYVSLFQILTNAAVGAIFLASGVPFGSSDEYRLLTQPGKEFGMPAARDDYSLQPSQRSSESLIVAVSKRAAIL